MGAGLPIGVICFFLSSPRRPDGRISTHSGKHSGTYRAPPKAQAGLLSFTPLQGRHEVHNTRKQNVRSRATRVLLPLITWRDTISTAACSRPPMVINFTSELNSFTPNGGRLARPYLP